MRETMNCDETILETTDLLWATLAWQAIILQYYWTQAGRDKRYKKQLRLTDTIIER